MISLASGTLPEFDPPTVVEAAAAAGFDGCGIWFDPESFTPAVLRATERAFGQAGIRPLEIEVIILGDRAQEPFQQQLLETGAALGATEAIVVSREPELSKTTDLLGALNESASRLGVHLCLEFLPIFAVANLENAISVIRSVDHENVKLLVDPLHLARSGSSLDNLRNLPSSWFSFAQFCDATGQAPGDGGFEALYDEAVNGRLLPGEGELPLGALIDALPAGLPLSLELRAGWLRELHPDPEARARWVLAGMNRWAATHGGFDRP